jgi:hypothetical protein
LAASSSPVDAASLCAESLVARERQRERKGGEGKRERGEGERGRGGT